MYRITVVLIAIAAVIAFVGCDGQPKPSSPPNVLLISIDALRADHLGAWGYGRDTSVFLDELASQGTRYPLAFVNTHGTPPSHTTILTSLYQETHRVGIADETDQPQDLSLPAEAETLQDILGRNGWTTVAVTGGGYMGDEFGFSRGFDVFEDQPRTVEQGTETLVRVLRQRLSEQQPVFALFHTYEVHSPYESPDSYNGLFGPDTCSSNSSTTRAKITTSQGFTRPPSTLSSMNSRPGAIPGHGSISHIHRRWVSIPTPGNNSSHLDT